MTGGRPPSLVMAALVGLVPTMTVILTAGRDSLSVRRHHQAERASNSVLLRKR